LTAHKIKTAALRLFAEKGYDATPLSEIANTVGIKTPSLYAHFSGKEDLFRAVFEDVLEEQLRRIEALKQEIVQCPVHDKLYRIWQDACRAYFLSEMHMTFLKRSMLFPPRALQEELRERFAVTEDVLSAILTAIFNEGMDSGLIRREQTGDLLASYYCLLDGAFIQQFYYTSLNLEQRMNSVWRMYWQGIIISNS
jgi:AcrR family transcriptional regulator